MRSDWLDSFLVFSDCLNFTLAAQKLFISQPALYVKIKKFSEFIGSPLYRKQGRQLVLTPEGMQIQRFAREMQQRSNHFLADLREGVRQEPVRLAAGEGTFLYLLGPAIRHFQKKSPYPISLLNASGEAAMTALLNGQAHVAVSALQKIPDEIKQTQLTKVEQVVVMQKRHPLAKKKSLKLEDLDNEAIILPPRSRPHRETIEQAFAAKGLALNIAVEVTGWEVTLHFVKLGMGVSIVNSCCNIPANLLAFKLKELPALTYNILELKNAWYQDAMAELKHALNMHANHWQQRI